VNIERSFEEGVIDEFSLDQTISLITIIWGAMERIVIKKASAFVLAF
jgi:hypothetical protein